MYRIGKSYSFDASHQLHGLVEGHKCGRLHGHTYVVTVEIVGDYRVDWLGEDLIGPGFVIDFGELAPLKKYIDEKWDHRHLNDVMAVEPTSEHIAAHFYRWCVEEFADLPGGVRIAKVRVSETPSSWAEYGQ
jgi:6-pyruvoyltetrahydropterin/6-carboxytetrahydropterin synthase